MSNGWTPEKTTASFILTVLSVFAVITYILLPSTMPVTKVLKDSSDIDMKSYKALLQKAGKILSCLF